MTSRRSREVLKRRREGYQLFLQPHTELPPHQCSRTEGIGLAASPYGACNAPLQVNGCGDSAHAFDRPAASTPSAVPSSSLRSGGPTPQPEKDTPTLFPRDPNTLRLRLRPIRVDVVRGDTGRRATFLLAVTVLYAWHHGNRVYRSLAGEDAGVELRETVVCEVVGAPASPPWALGSSASAWQHHALLCNEEVAGAASGAAAARCDTCAVVRGDAPASPDPFPLPFVSPQTCYSYEATQVSRRLTPPTCPSWQSVDVAAHLGSSTPALFVECLLKCVHDEAVLSDDCGWVYLYHGRHVMTEIGRKRILQDLFAHAYDGGDGDASTTAESGVSLATLTICVFRKH